MDYYTLASLFPPCSSFDGTTVPTLSKVWGFFSILLQAKTVEGYRAIVSRLFIRPPQPYYLWTTEGRYSDLKDTKRYFPAW